MPVMKLALPKTPPHHTQQPPPNPTKNKPPHTKKQHKTKHKPHTNPTPSRTLFYYIVK
jgi:hypothetical protein